MGKVFAEIDDKLASFINEQKMFFVATAPMAGDGLINVSPKGLEGTFAILGPKSVAYLDLTGSGIETVAHVRENQRIVVMFCAFEGRPKILRLYGRGEVLEPKDEQFDDLAKHFDDHPGTRSIIRVDVTRIADACGFGVPLMDFVGERSQLTDYAERKGKEGLREYQGKKNRVSLDGLPGLEDLPALSPSA